MKLVSEKPPEAILGVIFLGEHAPRPAQIMAKDTIPHPVWQIGHTGFFLLPTALSLDICWENIGYCLPVCETKGYHTS